MERSSPPVWQLHPACCYHEGGSHDVQTSLEESQGQLMQTAPGRHCHRCPGDTVAR